MLETLPTTPDFDYLFDKHAANQDGFFTAQQAYQSGYSRQCQSYHVKCGDWERPSRGIFRIKHYPCPPNWHIVVAYLWATDRLGNHQAIISHDTALNHYNLSTSWPSSIHLTVPLGFRRESACPFKVQLHYKEVDPSDIEYYGFMRITNPLRTILDLLTAGYLEHKHMCEAMRDGLHNGLIVHAQLVITKLTPEEEHLLFDLLKDINYERLNDLQQSRKIQKSTA